MACRRAAGLTATSGVAALSIGRHASPCRSPSAGFVSRLRTFRNPHAQQRACCWPTFSTVFATYFESCGHLGLYGCVLGKPHLPMCTSRCAVIVRCSAASRRAMPSPRSRASVARCRAGASLCVPAPPFQVLEADISRGMDDGRHRGRRSPVSRPYYSAQPDMACALCMSDGCGVCAICRRGSAGDRGAMQ